MASVVNKEIGTQNTVISHIRHKICSRFKVLGIINQKRLSQRLNFHPRQLGQCIPGHIQAFYGDAALVFISGTIVGKYCHGDSVGLLFTVNKDGQILSFIKCWIKPDQGYKTRFVVNDMDIAFALSNEIEKCQLQQRYQTNVYQLFEKEDEFSQIPYNETNIYHTRYYDPGAGNEYPLQAESIFESFSPDRPLDIALSSTGSVLGCFRENIKQYSQNGSVDRTIEVGADCITETLNKNICATKGSDIFLINEQNTITHRFSGAAHKANFTSAVDIVSDSHGRILVAENGKIHIFDQELCYIGVVMSWLRDGMGSVASIDVDMDDNLWILDNNSVVWVVKYHI